MYTWSVYNTSTGLYVVEPDDADSDHLTEDEARREACDFLVREADADTNDESATLLDHAAQDLNLSNEVKIEGVFSWLVEVRLATGVEA